MGTLRARSPAGGFREAAHWYIARHQACAACEASHCVVRTDGSGGVDYSCMACGFSVCHEPRTSSYLVAAGDETEAEMALAKRN